MTLRDELESMKEISERNDELSEEFENQTMQMVFVDVRGSGTANTIRVRHDLEEFYRLLQCNTIDMPMRSIGGKSFQIICDDEGLLDSGYRVSAFGKTTWEPMMVGNLLICQYRGEGEIRGLTDDEAAYIMQHVKRLAVNFNGHPERWQVIADMDY